MQKFEVRNFHFVTAQKQRALERPTLAVFTLFVFGDAVTESLLTLAWFPHMRHTVPFSQINAQKRVLSESVASSFSHDRSIQIAMHGQGARKDGETHARYLGNARWPILADGFGFCVTLNRDENAANVGTKRDSVQIPPKMARLERSAGVVPRGSGLWALDSRAQRSMGACGLQGGL